jgi:hypothetical protein
MLTTQADLDYVTNSEKERQSGVTHIIIIIINYYYYYLIELQMGFHPLAVVLQ